MCIRDRFKGFTVESDNLPNVSISATSSVELPTKEDFSATWKNPQVNHQSEMCIRDRFFLVVVSLHDRLNFVLEVSQEFLE